MSGFLFLHVMQNHYSGEVGKWSILYSLLTL